MAAQRTAPYSDVLEVADLAWQVSEPLRWEAFHDNRAACTPVRDRGCGARCQRAVTALAVGVAIRVPATAGDRAGWRRQVRGALQDWCDLAAAGMRRSRAAAEADRQAAPSDRLQV